MSTILSRFMRSVSLGGRKVALHLAEEIQSAGYERKIDLIDSKLLNATLDKVQDALESNTLALSSNQVNEATTVIVTSMSHSSQADPIPHSTIRVRNAQNYDVAVGHVADDASQQLPARDPR